MNMFEDPRHLIALSACVLSLVGFYLINKKPDPLRDEKIIYGGVVPPNPAHLIPEHGEIVTVKSVKPVSKRQRIYNYVLENPGCTRQEIEKATGFNTKTVQGVLKKLSDSRKLIRKIVNDGGLGRSHFSYSAKKNNNPKKKKGA